VFIGLKPDAVFTVVFPQPRSDSLSTFIQEIQPSHDSFFPFIANPVAPSALYKQKLSSTTGRDWTL
jgi:hypothetical protein